MSHVAAKYVVDSWSTVLWYRPGAKKRLSDQASSQKLKSFIVSITQKDIRCDNDAVTSCL